ncbi:hypothetical protein NDN95_25835, partial [Burkholderia glumae]|uniref:hypothetical protein n=1 Tax=Burkholderia glumae TaxID=337 RepID=UPI0020371A5D
SFAMRRPNASYTLWFLHDRRRDGLLGRQPSAPQTLREHKEAQLANFSLQPQPANAAPQPRRQQQVQQQTQFDLD